MGAYADGRVHCSTTPSARPRASSIHRRYPPVKKTPWRPSTFKHRRVLRLARTPRCRRAESSSGCGLRSKPPSSNTTARGAVFRSSWPWPAPPSPQRSRCVHLRHPASKCIARTLKLLIAYLSSFFARLTLELDQCEPHRRAEECYTAGSQARARIFVPHLSR